MHYKHRNWAISELWLSNVAYIQTDIHHELFCIIYISYIHPHTHTHTHTHIHTHIHTHTHAHTHTYKYIYVYVCVVLVVLLYKRTPLSNLSQNKFGKNLNVSITLHFFRFRCGRALLKPAILMQASCDIIIEPQLKNN